MTQLDAQTELSASLPTITAEINAYKRVAGEAIFEIGRRLKHVKENDLAHGQFGEWLMDVGINDRVARQMMLVHKELGGSERRTSSDLGLQALYEIATLPIDERGREHTLESGATKSVDEMTVRELREVKAALKAEREARAKAESDYETVRDTLEAVREQPPIIEKQTEYIRDTSAEDRLARYTAKFGDIELYEQTSARIGNITDVSASIQTFSYEVRAMLKRYAYLAQYSSELSRMQGTVLDEYDTALDAALGFVRTLRNDFDGVRTGANVINI